MPEARAINGKPLGVMAFIWNDLPGTFDFWMKGNVVVPLWIKLDCRAIFGAFGVMGHYATAGIWVLNVSLT